MRVRSAAILFSLAACAIFVFRSELVQATVTGEIECSTSGSQNCSGGLYVDNGSSNGLFVAGTGTTSSYVPAYFSQATTSTSQESYAAYGNHYGSASTSALKAAIKGRVSGNNGSLNVGVFGEAISSQGGDTSTNSGVKGYASGNATNYGLLGEAWYSATANYGVRAYATQGTTNYGIYAEASGGTYNYAGYFQGDVEVTGDSNVVGNVTAEGDITSEGTITASADMVVPASQNFKYASARTFYWMTNANDFVEERSNAPDILRREPTYKYAYVYSGDGAPYQSSFFKRVDLPNGATVTNLTCMLYDNDTNGFASTVLQRINVLSMGSAQNLAQVSTSLGGTETSNPTQDTTISYATIDNSTYSYVLYGGIYASAAGPSYIRFYGCRITYTLDSLQP